MADDALQRLREICLALPEAAERETWGEATFRVRDKHVTTTMDSSEVDSQFELRDVPWVQYFKGGVALHAAPWHDDFGKPRSHGCINMAPIDARRVFLFSEPQLPKDWHGVSTPQEGSEEGTIVHIHP